jgi:hypothetical protein
MSIGCCLQMTVRNSAMCAVFAVFLLLTLLTRRQSASGQQLVNVNSRTVTSKSFRPVVLPENGSHVCANDDPSALTSVEEIVGFNANGIPDEVRCSFQCTRLPNCTSFNVRRYPHRRCETYNYVPRNCSVSVQRLCRHFQVRFGFRAERLGECLSHIQRNIMCFREH